MNRREVNITLENKIQRVRVHSYNGASSQHTVELPDGNKLNIDLNECLKAGTLPLPATFTTVLPRILKRRKGRITMQVPVMAMPNPARSKPKGKADPR